MLRLLLLLSIGGWMSAQEQEGEWVLVSDEYPSDPRLVPAIGNAHVATQVLGDTMYVNNVYNGRTTTSHRARVPSSVAIWLDEDMPSQYVLNMRQGVFYRHITLDDYHIDQRIYAHRVSTRILVNDITVTRTNPEYFNDIILDITNNMGAESMDMDLTTVEHDPESMFTSGTIKETETEESDFTPIYQYWTKIPSSITLPGAEESNTWSFLTSISIDQSDAITEFELANGKLTDDLFQEHVDAWENIWNHGNIQVYGNLTLSQTLNAALFHILISTPDVADPINPFAGLSPGGLARGGVVEPNMTTPYNDYYGHVFWDMDTWIMPPVMLFHPNMAKIMISSRSRVINAVRDNAVDSGYAGVRYPWEQAHTGYETCPWEPAALYQIHVTAEVALSIRQYMYATKDLDFINDEMGKTLAMDIGRYWESRSVETDPNRIEIFGVMGPDEYASNVNNSVFTNYNAILSLTLAAYLEELGIEFDPQEGQDIREWERRADDMFLLFDEDRQYHPQYEGFEIEGSIIKQSDVVLLGYPLMKEMTPEVRRNDLEIYEELTDKFGPDTGTWSMHTVGWLELNNQTKADEMFWIMFRNINGPFKIFSEKPADDHADGMRATNFITGAGGMLQAVMFGYVGFRLKPSSLDLDPVILPGADSWDVNGVDYRGFTMDFSFTQDVMTITMVEESGNAGEILAMETEDSNEYFFEVGVPVVISRQKGTFEIRS